MVAILSPHERGVTHTAASPYVRLKAVPICAVRLREGFWRPRLEANVHTSLPTMYRLLEEHGVIDNFRRVYGAKNVPRRGLVFTDSDIYKWMEAASFVLQSQEAPEIQRLLDEAIEAILPAQREDGYLNTYYVDDRYHQRYTRLETDHELYCAGHLFQAAVAHHRATGSTKLLDCALRFADHLCQVIPTLPGAFDHHPEVEMALVELYRETGRARYLELARLLLDNQRLSEFQKIEGHAVRALYFCCGGADCYAEMGDPAYLASLERQWQNFTQAKVYITGGAGGRYVGESLGKDYELPNARAYAETCAAIASIMWNWRMLALNGEARFADLLERTLYNGFLAGVSLDGARYFYVNPLSYDGQGEEDPWYPWARRGLYERQPWYDCTCCPPNVQRLLASLPGYFYSTSEDGVWVHLYDNNDLDWRLTDGTGLRLSQTTRYPWDGDVELTITPARPIEFTLYLRVPAWAGRTTVAINGQPANITPTPGQYLALRRVWQPADHVRLSLEMAPTVMVSHPRAAENRCSVAIQRGPIVYCLEAHDNPGFSVLDALLDPQGEITAHYRPDLLGGVTVLTAAGAVPVEPGGPLYRPWSATRPAVRPVTLTAIPYYAWNNRGPCAMTVWMREGGR